jgi:hypothetical protein
MPASSYGIGFCPRVGGLVGGHEYRGPARALDLLREGSGHLVMPLCFPVVSLFMQPVCTAQTMGSILLSSTPSCWSPALQRSVITCG